jgi:hypothetical protein
LAPGRDLNAEIAIHVTDSTLRGIATNNRDRSPDDGFALIINNCTGDNGLLHHVMDIGQDGLYTERVECQSRKEHRQ